MFIIENMFLVVEGEQRPLASINILPTLGYYIYNQG